MTIMPNDLIGTPWRGLWLSERDGIWCLVDAIDFEWLSANLWNVSWGSRTPWQRYGKRNIGPDRATVRMHREIMLRAEPDGYGPKLHVDHVNGQTLDNRRANLRWATNAQNSANRRERSQILSLDVIVQQLMQDALRGALKPQLEEIPW